MSERTVRRDIVRLQALDVAVETLPGRGGGVTPTRMHATALDLPLAAHLEREGEGVRMTVPAKPASLPWIALHLLALPFEVTVRESIALREALARLASRASEMAREPDTPTP